MTGRRHRGLNLMKETREDQVQRIIDHADISCTVTEVIDSPYERSVTITGDYIDYILAKSLLAKEGWTVNRVQKSGSGLF